MDKYVLAIDIGSTNTKIVCMHMQTNIQLVFLEIFNTLSKDLFIEKILEILNKYNIQIEDLEVFLMTGSGSSFYEDSILGIKIIKISEFDCIGLGGLVLSKYDEALIVNLGTGTTICYANYKKIEYVGGTALGGGTLLGLSKRLNLSNSYDDLYDKISKGNADNVDLMISDISKTNIDKLPLDISASNFAAFNKKATNEDILAGILRLIVQNIGLIVYHIKEKLELKYNIKLKIVCIGSFLNKKIVKEYFKQIQQFTNTNYNYVDDKYTSFATSIGLYEYYFLYMRENILNEKC